VRVLFAAHHEASTGGAQRALLDLAPRLARAGMTIHVTAPRDGDLLSRARAAGLETHVIDSPWWLTTASPAHRSHSQAIVNAVRTAHGRWRALLAAVAPDAVVTCTIAHPTPAFAATTLGIPHLWWIQEFGEIDHDLQFVFGERQTLALVGLLSAKVLACSNAVRDRLIGAGLPPATVATWYYGISVATCHPPRQDDGRLQLLQLGRISESKGTHVAIAAVRAAIGMGSNCWLRIVGAQSREERVHLHVQLERLGLADRVQVLPWSDDLDRAIAEADVILVPSRCEAFGRVTVEALRRGRPVVACRSGGSPELIAHKRNGWLFTPWGAPALAELLAEIGADRRQLALCTAAASSSIADRFLPDEQNGKFVSALKEIVL
jgi:glycosyltransferase involved in cell wall biosynthesis